MDNMNYFGQLQLKILFDIDNECWKGWGNQILIMEMTVDKNYESIHLMIENGFTLKKKKRSKKQMTYSSNYYWNWLRSWRSTFANTLAQPEYLLHM